MSNKLCAFKKEKRQFQEAIDNSHHVVTNLRIHRPFIINRFLPLYLQKILEVLVSPHESAFVHHPRGWCIVELETMHHNGGLIITAAMNLSFGIALFLSSQMNVSLNVDLHKDRTKFSILIGQVVNLCSRNKNSQFIAQTIEWSNCVVLHINRISYINEIYFNFDRCLKKGPILDRAFPWNR